MKTICSYIFPFFRSFVGFFLCHFAFSYKIFSCHFLLKLIIRICRRNETSLRYNDAESLWESKKVQSEKNYAIENGKTRGLYLRFKRTLLAKLPG